MKSARQIQLEAFLEEDPGDPFTHYALALEFIKGNQVEEGIAKMEWLVANHPEYLATYYQLGKLYQNDGRNHLAIDIFKKGIELAKSLKNNHALGELKGALEEFDPD